MGWMEMEQERAWLVQLCARLTGSRDAAEDLAQETLMVAWRKEQTLHDPDRRQAWLAGIARKRCLHWLRARGRSSVPPLEPRPAGDEPLALLERQDLERLLRCALSELPDETRRVLLWRFLEELPHAEIGRRLGLSEGAVWMRVARGRERLRRLLLDGDPALLGALGLATGDGWQETDLWCTSCGRQRLIAYRHGADLRVDCPGCITSRGRRAVQVRSLPADRMLGLDLGPAPDLTSQIDQLREKLHARVAAGVLGLSARCTRCGARVRVRIRTYGPGQHEARVDCTRCGARNGFTTSWGVAGSTPQLADFWRRHRRIHTLPAREVDGGGGRLSVISFERVGGGARLDVLLSSRTLAVRKVHEWHG